MGKISALLGQELLKRGCLISVAESCTGGGLAQAIVSEPGASQWFDCGVVSYSNESKISLLGVSPALLEAHGAVSAEVAAAMAEGCLTRSRSSLALSTTGVAGPGGGTADKPVGTVFVGLASRFGATQTRLLRCSGSREAIQKETIETLLAWVCEYMQSEPDS